MPSTTQRYPLSTPDGISIPLDVIRPHSFLLLPFTLVVSSAVTVPTGVEIMSVTASEDCIICFGGTAVTPVAGTIYANTIEVEKDMRITMAPTATTFTVIGEDFAGDLRVQFLDKWAGLTLETQQQRR